MTTAPATWQQTRPQRRRAAKHRRVSLSGRDWLRIRGLSLVCSLILLALLTPAFSFELWIYWRI